MSRIDTLDELDYFRNGGIMPYVLRNLAQAAIAIASGPTFVPLFDSP